MPLGEMLRLAEVEREQGVSRWTLYEWLRSGKLVGVKLACGHYRVPAPRRSKDSSSNWNAVQMAPQSR